MLIIHCRDFQRSTTVKIFTLIASSRRILKIVEATYRWWEITRGEFLSRSDPGSGLV
jgi:hypothetical protein